MKCREALKLTQASSFDWIQKIRRFTGVLVWAAMFKLSGFLPIPLVFYTRHLFFTIGGFLISALFTTILHLGLEETLEQLDRGQLYNYKRGQGGMAGTAPPTWLESCRVGCAAPRRVLRLLVRPYLSLYREKKTFLSLYMLLENSPLRLLVIDAV